MFEQDPMTEVFIFENQQLLESLEEILLQGEKQHSLNDEQINEIFRIMHTIKGSSSMMQFDSLTNLSHAVEDLFSQIREKKARSGDWDNIFDIVLTASDLIKEDIAKIQNGLPPDSESTKLIESIHSYLGRLSMRKQEDGAHESAEIVKSEEPGPEDADASFYKLRVAFEKDCQMENMRAFGVANALEPYCYKLAHLPEDLMEEAARDYIAANGFEIYIFSGENPDTIKKVAEGAMFVESASIVSMNDNTEDLPEKIRPAHGEAADAADHFAASARTAPELTSKQNFISVNVNKLDSLLNLVGEIVTTESMVTRSPDIADLKLEGFARAGQQLRKLINELQEIVMSIRMVPVSTTFHKMRRIVRDMCKKVSKEVDLVIIGEDTEVDKNIVDHLSDPLMHLIRNAVDHGIEPGDERIKNGKPAAGRVTLEARSSGDAVVILVSDDGRGLNREKIVKKAIEKGVTSKTDAELSDKEAYNLIFFPGFSTNESVTEFSGRGVGMDVVRKNIEKVGGSISVESTPGEGSTMQIRIPLTLAIVEGMKLRVGGHIFIVPMLSIVTSFKPDPKDVFHDPDENEMIMVRGECFPIYRLNKIFGLQSESESLFDGILIQIKTESSVFCLHVDALIGEQQAVTKPLPEYIQRSNLGLRGISGCTILGDGSISLIIDINTLVE